MTYFLFIEEIMKKIKEAGFHIAARKQTELTRDIAEQFYAEHQDKDYFGDLTDHMARYEYKEWNKHRVTLLAIIWQSFFRSYSPVPL